MIRTSVHTRPAPPWTPPATFPGPDASPESRPSHETPRPPDESGAYRVAPATGGHGLIELPRLDDEHIVIQAHHGLVMAQ